MLRGDLDRARRVIDTPGQPDALLIIANNAWSAIVGYVAADHELLDRLASWQAVAEEALKTEVRATNEPSPLSGPALNVHWARAVIERRFDDALPLMRIAHDGTPTSPALRSYVLVPLATRLLDAGAVEELAGLVTILAADVERLDDAPLPRTDLHYLRAVVARAAGDIDTAWTEAHRALEIAHPARLGLRVVDDLHLLAVLAHERGQTASAARLFAAARTERDRIGYLACELPGREAVDAIGARLEATEVDAWAEGSTLGLAAAVDYARRARGQRSRPASGWASLTPTETRVATLVAQGHSNHEVARQLLMSVATVKAHLTHVYTKTGVTSRAKLAATLPSYARSEPTPHDT
jgi:DNA-binding CsgD family transcriptional regulator